MTYLPQSILITKVPMFQTCTLFFLPWHSSRKCQDLSQGSVSISEPFHSPCVGNVELLWSWHFDFGNGKLCHKFGRFQGCNPVDSSSRGAHIQCWLTVTPVVHCCHRLFFESNALQSVVQGPCHPPNGLL